MKGMLKRPITPSRNFKEDLDQFEAKGLNLINDQQLGFIAILRAQKDIIRGLSNVGITILQKMDDASRGAGIEIQDAVKLIGLYYLMHRIAELGIAANVLYTLNNDQFDLAYALTVQNYVKAEVSAGRIDPVSLMQTMQRNMTRLSPEEQKKAQIAIVRIQQLSKQYAKGQLNGNAQ